MSEPREPLADGALGSVRIDRYLNAARIFKSRSDAQEACAAGHVKVGERAVDASHRVKVGDRVEARAPRGKVILVVLEVAEKRLGPVPARKLYEDHSPPPEPVGPDLAVRPRGFGRPTKSDRRRIQRLRGY